MSAPGAGPAWTAERALPPLLAVAIAWLLLPRVAGFTTDSESYLDIAGNVLSGAGLVQRVVDFWRPAAPDPLGLWPPLYPLTVAFLARAGLRLELAARMVSVLAFVGFAIAFRGLARRVLGRAAALGTTVLALSTVGVATAAVMAWSEMLFLALVTGALTGLVELTRNDRVDPSPWRPVVLGALAGLAALTRYIGWFLPLLGIALLVRARSPRRVVIVWALAALVLPACWAVRGIALFGSPMGPGATAATVSLGEALRGALTGLHWGFVPLPIARVPWLALVVTAAIGAAVVFALRRRDAAGVAAWYAVAYLFVLLAVRSQATLSEAGGLELRALQIVDRYLIPIYPFLWLGAAGAVDGAVRGTAPRRAAGAVLVLAVLASGVGLAQGIAAAPVPPAETVAREADLAALRALVPAEGGPVLTDVGHRLRNATGRSAIQVPPRSSWVREFTAQEEARWRAAGVREAVFRSKAVAAPTASQTYGPYLASRLRPGSPGAWTVVAERGGFMLYRIP